MAFEKIIIGGGFYGLYAGLLCARRGERVLLLEIDDGSFQRASYINQARVHMGYHYPRSIATALKSIRYFDRFVSDYGDCIHSSFDQIYAISSGFSWTDARQFKKFCDAARIPCEELAVNRYFKDGMCNGAFVAKEYTYDAQILMRRLLKEAEGLDNFEIRYNAGIDSVRKDDSLFVIRLKSGEVFNTPFVINATYASVNQVLALFGYEPFQIKYELCEVILCEVRDLLANTGITVMDGPFFSIMPFGKTGLHSLTSVSFTPHVASFEDLPSFECQKTSDGSCSPRQLGNCNNCPCKPRSAWPQMSRLARKYLKEEYGFSYRSSLYSIKPILKSSEIDDSRPTVIRKYSENPTFVSVLSGKINTIYDLDEVLM